MKIRYNKTAVLTKPCPYEQNRMGKKSRPSWAKVGSRYCIRCLHNAHCGDTAWHNINDHILCNHG